MTCSTCTQWKPKDSGAMAKHGLCICALGPRWQFLPPQHTCPKHKPVAADVQAARVVWLGKLQK